MFTGIVAGFKGLGLVWRVLTVGAAVVVVSLAVWGVSYVLTGGGKARGETATANAGAAMSKARSDSAIDALQSGRDADAGAAADESTTAHNGAAINAVDGADQPIPKAVADEARRRICKRPSAVNDPTCARYRGE